MVAGPIGGLEAWVPETAAVDNPCVSSLHLACGCPIFQPSKQLSLCEPQSGILRVLSIELPASKMVLEFGMFTLFTVPWQHRLAGPRQKHYNSSTYIPILTSFIQKVLIN